MSVKDPLAEDRKSKWRPRARRFLGTSGCAAVAFAVAFSCGGCNKKPKQITTSTPGTNTDSQIHVVDANLRSVPGFEADNRYVGHLQPILQKAKPNGDSWDTEVFAEAAANQLKKIAEYLGDLSQSDAALDSVVAKSVKSQALRPSRLTTVMTDGTTTVRRYITTVNKPTDDYISFSSASHPLRSPSLDAHFKLVKVERRDDRVLTRVIMEALRTQPASELQQTAEWEIEWIGWESPAISAILSYNRTLQLAAPDPIVRVSTRFACQSPLT